MLQQRKKRKTRRERGRASRPSGKIERRGCKDIEKKRKERKKKDSSHILDDDELAPAVCYAAILYNAFGCFFAFSHAERERERPSVFPSVKKWEKKSFSSFNSSTVFHTRTRVRLFTGFFFSILR